MRLIWRIARMSFLIMVVCVAVVVLFPHAMLSVYTNEPALLVESVPSLYVIAGAMIMHQWRIFISMPFRELEIRRLL
nr:MatE [uncultured Bacteroides sp.]